MPSNSMMKTAVIVALFFLTVRAVAEAEAPPPSTMGCTDVLLSFSPCLPYVSSPPNNLTHTASQICCDAVSSAVDSGGALCFCYLLGDTSILGFPLDTERLLSLSSLCTPSFELACSESPTLPPLSSAETLGSSSRSGGRGSGAHGGGGRGHGSQGRRVVPKSHSKGRETVFAFPIGASTHHEYFSNTYTFLILLTLPLLHSLCCTF